MRKTLFAVIGLLAFSMGWVMPSQAATIDVTVGVSSDKFTVLNRSDAASITRLSFDFALGGFNLGTPSYFFDGGGPDVDLSPTGYATTGGIVLGQASDGPPLLVHFTPNAPNHFGPDTTFRDFMAVRTNLPPPRGQLGLDEFGPLTMFIDLSTGDQIILTAGLGSLNGTPGFTPTNAGQSIKGITYTLSYNFTFDEGTMPAPPVPLPASGLMMLLAGAAVLPVVRASARRRSA